MPASAASAVVASVHVVISLVLGYIAVTVGLNSAKAQHELLSCRAAFPRTFCDEAKQAG